MAVADGEIQPIQPNQHSLNPQSQYTAGTQSYGTGDVHGSTPYGVPYDSVASQPANNYQQINNLGNANVMNKPIPAQNDNFASNPGPRTPSMPIAPAGKSKGMKYGTMGGAGAARIFMAPFRGSRGASTFRRDIYYAGLRSTLSSTEAHHFQSSMDTTDQVLSRTSSENLHVLESIRLGEGAVGHWLYRSSAKYVLLYFHGGGYIQPMTVGHAKYLFALQRKVNRMGFEMAVFAVGYTLAPEKTYPGQLAQAVAALRYLTERQGRRPRNILIGGDASGGNLAAALLLHLANPHPAVPSLQLDGPLRAALLISPWVSFDLTAPSFKKNQYSDYMTVKALERGFKTFTTSPEQPDAYCEPLRAPVEWWQRVASIVGEMLIWGGGSEVLIDGIREFAVRVEVGFEREFQERGQRRPPAPVTLQLPNEGEKKRDSLDDASDVSKSPATPPREGEDGFNFGFHKRGGFTGATPPMKQDELGQHPALKFSTPPERPERPEYTGLPPLRDFGPSELGPVPPPLEHKPSLATAEDIQTIERAAHAPGAELLNPGEDTKRKRASLAQVEEEDYLKVAANNVDTHPPRLDTEVIHPLEHVMSPSTAQDINLIEAVQPHDDASLLPPVDKAHKRASMAEKEEDDYLETQAAYPSPDHIHEHRQGPGTRPIQPVQSTTTAQDVHLIEEIIEEAEFENQADRASLSDYGDHGPLPGDAHAKHGVRHSWGIHRMAPSHGGDASQTHHHGHHLRRASLAEKEEDDYVNVPEFGGHIATSIDEHALEWPQAESRRRVKYIETPRMAHEEMIVDYTLKIRGKREGARSIERWFETVLGPDKKRASMMPMSTGEADRKKYLKAERARLEAEAKARAEEKKSGQVQGQAGRVPPATGNVPPPPPPAALPASGPASGPTATPAQGLSTVHE